MTSPRITPQTVSSSILCEDDPKTQMREMAARIAFLESENEALKVRLEEKLIEIAEKDVLIAEMSEKDKKLVATQAKVA